MFGLTRRGEENFQDELPTQHHVDPMNPHHLSQFHQPKEPGQPQAQPEQPQPLRPVVGSPVMDQTPCNQSQSSASSRLLHQHQPHQYQHQHQNQQHQQQQQSPHRNKTQILPRLLSPRPTSLKSELGETHNSSGSSSNNTTGASDDHDQIIDQVISLENEYIDASSAMLAGNVALDASSDIVMGHQHQPPQHQHQLHHLGDINLNLATNLIAGNSICLADSNQLSSSSEDLLNLLLEFDREPSHLIGGLEGGQQLDQDEKVGIENIRKQLMSCEMQSEQQQQNTNSMSPIVSQMNCQQEPRNQHRDSVHSVTHQQQLVSQTTPVIPMHQQQSHQIQTSIGPDLNQANILHGNYPMSPVPVSSSGQQQSFTPQPHQQQRVGRISSQSNPMSIVGNSPSPSWQQPQLSPFSPQPPSNHQPRTPTQRQVHHPMQQQQATTSPQLQQLQQQQHTSSLQQRSPSQSVSPPILAANSEPSPVVKKNPLLNAQLINSRAPSIAPTRFMNNQMNVLNQNPILNAKLSQSPYITNNCGSPVNHGLNPQSRFVQQQQQQQQSQQTTNFNYDITQRQQPHNAQQHAPQQQPGHMTLYGPCDQQQQQQQQQSTNQIFRTTTATPTGMNPGGGPQVSLGSTSPSGGLSQQVKQEIRRKVQQPKQQHQTTSLLKQLLSDDNK